MTRYALYAAPERDSVWWQRGCQWLGRDPETGLQTDLPVVAGVPITLQRQLTHNARRYGFHATLKAPFSLADGFDEADLLSMARAFAQHQAPLQLPQPTVGALGAFLALQPGTADPTINALAMRCVSYFDLLRAPPNEVELARRRQAGLTPRQDALLLRWGYPFVEEAYRFHMTLSDALTGVDPAVVAAFSSALRAHFVQAGATPMSLQSLAVFREARAGADFNLIARFPFLSTDHQARLPTSGRLFFIVGPSGSGKDTLLRWVIERLPASADWVVARRTITRPADANEDCESLDPDAFWQAAAAGQFTMLWQAHGLCYGIRRGLDAALCAGRDVIINGSREYIPQLRLSYPQAQVIWIEAGAEQIRRRITDRRRESGPALLRRLERATQFSADESPDVKRIDNSGALEDAGAQLLALLSQP